MSRSFDIAVAGAGVMGLACALEEARRGRRVGVFDPAGTGSKASSAAAGILVTRDAHAFASPFREFYVRSIRRYPEWLAGISAASGMEIPLHRGGDHLIFDLDDPAAVLRLEAKQRQLERERASDFTVTDTLPGILEGHCRIRKAKAFHFPGEAYVQNRVLLEALNQACLKAGVAFLAEAPSSPWEHGAGTTRLRFAAEEWDAGQVLIAAGAWSVRLLESLGLDAPMVSVKGQLIRIRKFHGSDAMIHLNDDLYLVPRGDSLVVGATTEPGIWDEEFNEKGEAHIGSRLDRLLPEVSREPLERWAGLRPRTRDRLPWMGWIDPERGWALCTGHYKCGISMAPLAAESMSRLLHGEKTAVDLSPFNPWRRQGLTRTKA
ncbi:MAG: glycine oxidase [Fibrobacteres bacterium]|nr:glycine oxidase [Fibrobacterota bacterium]